MLALALLLARDYEAALEQTPKTLEIETSYFSARVDGAAAHYMLGRPDEALQAIEAAQTLAAQDAIKLSTLGAYQAGAGRAEDALRTVEQLKAIRSQRHFGAFLISCPYLLLGDMDHAYEWLETALEERDGQLVLIKHHPLLEGYPKDPRTKTFCGESESRSNAKHHPRSSELVRRVPRPRTGLSLLERTR